MLFDDNTVTYWTGYSQTFDLKLPGWWTEFQNVMPFHPSSYTLTRSTSKYCPISWALKARLAPDDEWTTISTVSKDYSLRNSDGCVTFPLPDDGKKWQYFRLEILFDGFNIPYFELSGFKFNFSQNF